MLPMRCSGATIFSPKLGGCQLSDTTFVLATSRPIARLKNTQMCSSNTAPAGDHHGSRYKSDKKVRSSALSGLHDVLE
eukprot:5902442-Amphidinium_carterae.1